jgi:uncharacterized protein involved in exopolysaccharide biosynthesis
MKKQSLKERLEIYENAMHRYTFHMTVSNNAKAAQAILDAMIAWSQAHMSSPLEVPALREQRIIEATDVLKNLP